MTPDILFDNFIIANDKYVADKFAADRYDEKNIIILLLRCCEKNLLLLANVLDSPFQLGEEKRQRNLWWR